MSVSQPASLAKHAYFALAFLMLLGLFFNPYEFGFNDQTSEIPSLKARVDSTLYAKDITIQAARQYISYLEWVMVPLFKAVGERDAVYFVYVLGRVLFYLAVFLIGRHLSGRPEVGLLAVMLLFFPLQLTGGTGTLDPGFKGRAIGLNLSLLSVALLFARRWMPAGAAMCAAMAIHFVSAANALLFVVCYCALEWKAAKGERALTRGILVMAGWVGLGVALLLARKMTAPGGQPLFIIIDQEWMSMLLNRHSSGAHFIPDPKVFKDCILFSVLLLASFFFLKTPKDDAARRICFAGILSTVMGLVLTRVFSHHKPLLIGLQMSFLRVGNIPMILNYVLAAVLLSRLFSGWKLLAAGLVFVCLGQTHQLWALAAVLALLAAAGPKIARGDGGPSHGLACWAAVLVFLCLILAQGHKPLPPSVGTPDPRSMLGLQQAMRETTPKDALILVPPYEHVRDFRIFSERSIIGTWKDWTYSTVSRDFAFEMAGRLKDIGGMTSSNCKGFGCNNQAMSYYVRMSSEEMIRVARKYGATHIVIERNRRPLPLKSLYENDRYVLYLLPSAEAAPASA